MAYWRVQAINDNMNIKIFITEGMTWQRKHNKKNLLLWSFDLVYDLHLCYGYKANIIIIWRDINI